MILFKPGWKGAVLSIVLGFLLGVILMFAIAFAVMMIDSMLHEQKEPPNILTPEQYKRLQRFEERME